MFDIAATHLEDGPIPTEMKQKRFYLDSMPTDELWELHEQVVVELSRKLTAERDRLEDRLRSLGASNIGIPHPRFPKIPPKYRNPTNGNQTWAGRGKQPRWLTAQLQTGKQLSDFLIP